MLILKFKLHNIHTLNFIYFIQNYRNSYLCIMLISSNISEENKFFIKNVHLNTINYHLNIINLLFNIKDSQLNTKNSHFNT